MRQYKNVREESRRRSFHAEKFLAATVFLLSAAIAWSQPASPAASGRSGRGGNGRGLTGDREHPIMPIGTHIPDFSLPGADGKTHSLREWANAKLIAIVFECNHCPVSQIYEGRIKKLYEDYRGKGVALIAINPNNPGSVRLNEEGYTDLEDSLPEMKLRMADRHITWPYLYDGETQKIATQFGVVATPHIFIFDQDRKLRYQGRIDDNENEALVKSRDARAALDALLAGKPVPVENTRAFGCSTKWLSKAEGSQSRGAEMERIKAEPVNLNPAGADELKKLRANSSGKVQVVTFWSAKCTTCADTFHDLETTFRMYRLRAFTLVTVDTDPAADKPAVMDFLHSQYASGENLMSTVDHATIESTFGEKWKPNSIFTEVIAQDGSVIYRKEGKFALADLLALRRISQAHMPDTGYPGSQAYWQEDFRKTH
ncbi:MAG TPA: redoxin family protein [Bryobacteraceae bacterium]|nr:redoxin family protein [Bryobacteraceae bacterium]